MDTGEGPPTLFSLPEEIKTFVLQHLNAVDLSRLAQVCREFRRLARDQILWRTLSLQDWSEAYPSPGTMRPTPADWNGFYVHRKATEIRWQAGVKTNTRTLVGHSSAVFGARFVNDSHVVTAGSDQTIRIWNPSDASTLFKLTENAGVLGLAYDPISERIVTGMMDGGVKVFKINVETLSRLATLRVKDLRDILDRKKVRHSDCIEKKELVNRIKFYDCLPMIEQVQKFEGHFGEQRPVPGVAIHKDLVASGSTDGVKIWNAATGALDHTFSHRSCDVVELMVKEGMVISGGKDGAFNVWDLNKAKLKFNCATAHSGWIWCVQVNPDDEYAMYTGSVDTTVRQWDLRQKRVVATIGSHGREVAGLKVMWNRHRFVTGCFDGCVRLFDTRKNAMYAHFNDAEERISRVDVSADKIAACGFDGMVRLYDFA